MTISTDRFDILFSRRNRLEEKAENLQSRIDVLEDRLESLDPITDYKKIQRIQNKLDEKSDLLAVTNYRVDRLTNKLPQDEFEITHRGDGMFDIDVTDSPYDDTYVGGTSLKFSVSGVQGTTRKTSSVVIESFEDEAGSSFVGGSSFRSIVDGYDDVTATLYGESNSALFSTEIF